MGCDLQPVEAWLHQHKGVTGGAVLQLDHRKTVLICAALQHNL